MAKSEDVYNHVPVGAILHLNQGEAQALHDVLRHIGGCPNTTRRIFTDNVLDVLRDIKCVNTEQVVKYPDIEGLIDFKP